MWLLGSKGLLLYTRDGDDHTALFFFCVCVKAPLSSLLFFCLLTFIRERKKPPPVVFLSLIILSLLLLTYLLGRFSHYCLPSVKKKPVAVISRNSLFFSIFVFCFSLLDTAVIRGDSRSAFFFFFFFWISKSPKEPRRRKPRGGGGAHSLSAAAFVR